MGRAKLKMELIPKEKSRNITLKRRKEGLIRKIKEFSTLCDVSSCIIIYGPRTENVRAEPEIWPRNPNVVKKIIGDFKSKNKESGYKNSSVSDFFSDRERKIEEELAKMKKKNFDAKYPTSPEIMNIKSESELRELGAALSNKFEQVKARIDFLKRRSNNQLGFNNNFVEFAPPFRSSANFYAPLPALDMMYQHADHHNQELHAVVNQNSLKMMMPVKNETDRFVKFEGTSASALCKREFYLESMTDAVDPMLCHNTRPLAQYYNYIPSDLPQPPLPLPPFPSYLYMMPGATVVPPQMRHFSNHEEKKLKWDRVR